MAVTYLSDSMWKYLLSAYQDIGYEEYRQIVAVPGSELSIMEKLGAEYCQGTDLIVMCSGINNVLNGYSVRNIVYLYEQTTRNLRTLYPGVHIAYSSLTHIAENRFTGEDLSEQVNPLIDQVNAELENHCNSNDSVHFIDLQECMNGKDGK